MEPSAATAALMLNTAGPSSASYTTVTLPAPGVAATMKTDAGGTDSTDAMTDWKAA